MHSRLMVAIASLLMISPFGSLFGQAIQMPYSKQTYTYKTVGQCKIHLTTYRMPGEGVRPAILWIHGGALIAGHREDIPEEQLKCYLDAGFVLVSIDYRLAPETKLNAIIEDVIDAYQWLRMKGPEILKIDPSRIAVVGGSAGGYLTLMAGSCLDPRPKAFVAFYGFGDIAGEWCNRPNLVYNQQPAVSKEEAYQAVDGPPLSEGSNHRFQFFLYCKQQGFWAKEVSGHNPDTEPRAFDAFCPVRNVTKDYPPTMLLHGVKDTDVPYQQSVLMAEILKQHSVEHDFITVTNGGHGFDEENGGMKDPANAERFKRVLNFLKRYAK